MKQSNLATFKHQNILKLLATLVLLINIASAGNRLVINNETWVEAELVEKNTRIQFTYHYPKGNWVGLGFGNHSMTNTPLFLLVTDESTTGLPLVYDCFSYGHGKPTRYETNNYRIKGALSTSTFFEIYLDRDLNITKRANESDVIPLDKTFEGIYAFHSEPLGPRHARTDRGVYKAIVNSHTGKVSFNEVDIDVFYKIHGIIMYISWSILTFVAAASTRYLKHLYQFKIILHASAGTLITSNTVIVVWLTLTEYNVEGSDLKYGHSAIGIILLVCVIVEFIGGLFVKQVSSVLNWKTKLALMSKMGHRIFAFIIIILSNWQVMGGLYNFESPVKKLIFVHYVVYILMFVI